MPNIPQIKIGNTTYDVKDSYAREQLDIQENEIVSTSETVGAKQKEAVGYTFNNGVFNVADKTYKTDNPIYKHLEYVLDGETQLLIGGYNYGVGYRAWAIVDSNNDVIKAKTRSATSAPCIENVIIPKDAYKIIVNIKYEPSDSDNGLCPCYIYKYVDEVIAKPDVRTSIKDLGGAITFGALFRGNGKISTGNTVYAYKTLSVSGGETLYLSGFSASINYPLFVILDANNNIILFPYVNYGGEKCISGYKVVVPPTGRKIIVNGFYGNGYGGPVPPKIETIINEYKGDLNDELAFDKRKVKVGLVSLHPACTYGYVVGKNGGLSQENAGYRHVSLSVTGGETYYLTGRHYTYNWPFYVFINGDGNVCKVAEPYTYNDNGRYFDVKVEAPMDAVTLKVNGYIDSDCDIKVANGVCLDEALQYRQPINIYNSHTKIDEITKDLVNGQWVYNSLKAENNLAKFGYAYAMMLHRIMTTYPLATVICCTNNECERLTANGLGVPDTNNKGETLTDYNETIIRIANVFGAIVVDHHSCGITYYNLNTYMQDFEQSTGFGLHPNAAGMDLIAKKTIADLKNYEWENKKLSVFGDSISTYNGSGSTNNQYPSGDITQQSQMWWHKSCIAELGMTLLTNASGGGRTVSTFREGISGRPKSGVNQDAINALAVNSTNPDVIIIKMGVNDFGNVGSSGNLDLNGHYHYGGL